MNRHSGTISQPRMVRSKKIQQSKEKTKRKKGILRKLPAIDGWILYPLLILIGIGLVMVFSADMYTSVIDGSGGKLFIKQLAVVLAGIALMLLCSRIKYQIFNNFYFAILAVVISAALLGAVLIWGVESNGAGRWIPIFGLTFQPSELAKVAGCYYMACVVTKFPNVVNRVVPFFCFCILPMALLCGLTIIEPSMSAAIAIAVPMAVIIFLANKRFGILVPIIILAIGAVAVFLIREPWRIERILVLFNGGTMDYQITQSLLAIGSGGVFGKGLGNGIQKYLFLPELQNDFIFANIGEELGLLGCLMVIALFSVLVFRGIKDALKAPDDFGFYYTAGVMVLIGFQAVVNIGVAVSVLPVTGMALPFVSAGGSSMIVLFLMMGPILNMTRQIHSKNTGGLL